MLKYFYSAPNRFQDIFLDMLNIKKLKSMVKNIGFVIIYFIVYFIFHKLCLHKIFY